MRKQKRSLRHTFDNRLAGDKNRRANQDRFLTPLMHGTEKGLSRTGFYIPLAGGKKKGLTRTRD